MSSIHRDAYHEIYPSNSGSVQHQHVQFPHSVLPNTLFDECGHLWLVIAMFPTRLNSSGIGLEPEPIRCNGLHHTKTRTIPTGPVLSPHTRHFNFTTLAPNKYLSRDHMVTWSVRWWCSSSRSSTSRSQLVIRPIFGESLSKTRWFHLQFPHISQPLNKYQSDRKSGSRGWKTS